MLKKVLKYDMKAISGVWWLGAVVSIVASFIGSLLLRFFFEVSRSNDRSSLLIVLSTLALVAGFLCIVGVSLSYAFTMVLVFVRFYKNFFTDEGYLTFTLPVKRSTLLFSKTLNAAIWLIAHIGVIAVSGLMFLLLVYPGGEGNNFIDLYLFEKIGEFFKNLWDELGAWLIVYIFEILLIIFVALIFSILLIHFCITFGCMLVKKAKLFLSIGIYYAFISVISLVTQLGSFLFTLVMYDGMWILIDNADKNQANAIFVLVILAITAAFATVAAVIYSVTQHMLDRKLNLQ